MRQSVCRLAVPARDMSRLERLLNLAAALSETRRGLSLEEVRERVPGYSEGQPGRRSFERDKEDLRALGLDISVEDLGQNERGYRMRPEDWAMGDLDLEPDEAAALVVAASIARLEGAAGPAALVGGAGIEKGDPVFFADLGQAGPAHAVAVDAITRRRPLAFTYRGEERHLDPYGLVLRNGRWYLVGHDSTRQARRAFRLDRIEGDLDAGPPNSFDLPDDFDPSEAVPGGAGVQEEGATTARLLLDAPVAWWGRRQLGPHRVVEERDDGAMVVEVDTDLPRAFVTFVASLLDEAEILEPEELRRELIDHVRPLVNPGGRGGGAAPAVQGDDEPAVARPPGKLRAPHSEE